MLRVCSPGTVINDDNCHVRGRHCVCNGNRGVLHDGDGATINGDHWIVFCANPASVVDNGHHNRIFASTNAEIEQYYTRQLSGAQRYRKRPPPRRVTIVWRGAVVAVYDARRVSP